MDYITCTHTHKHTHSKTTSAIHLISQFCRISCSRGDNAPVPRGGWWRWKWLKPDRESGLVIWNYCQPLTLIGVEVNVVLGEKKKKIMNTGRMSKRYCHKRGMRPFKTVDHWRCIFGHSERVQIASESKAGAFKNKKLIVITQDFPSSLHYYPVCIASVETRL